MPHLTMPKLSPTMESGTIAKWLKKPGDKIEVGDVIMEVATDKATVEHQALDPGYMRQIIVQEGEEAQVNQPIAIFTETADEEVKAEKTSAPAKSEQPVAAPVVQQPPKPQALPSGERQRVSPLAKKLAHTQGIDLSKIEGTGPGGRIVSRDLKAEPKVGSQEIPLTQIRKVIAQRLQEAKASIPHFYVTQTIDAEPLHQFREQLIKLDIKVSFNDCVVKACALALKEHMNVNAGFNAKNQTLIQFNTIDVSVAVSVDAGLITPIVFNADKKPLQEISENIRTLARKARDGKLQPQEFQGGSFTVSNLGMYGVDHFSAIINPPQAAILAVGGIIDQPVIREGKVVPGKTLSLTLSSDHRVVDGVAAAQFLKTLQKILENPVSLIL